MTTYPVLAWINCRFENYAWLLSASRRCAGSLFLIFNTIDGFTKRDQCQ